MFANNLTRWDLTVEDVQVDKHLYTNFRAPSNLSLTILKPRINEHWESWNRFYNIVIKVRLIANLLYRTGGQSWNVMQTK